MSMLRNREKNVEAERTVRNLISNLRNLVGMGRDDDRLCSDAARTANRAIDNISELAELFIDGYDSAKSANKVVIDATPSPTNAQWGRARNKVATTVVVLWNNVEERLRNGKLGNMKEDVLKLLDDHRQWVSQLTIREATR